VHIELTEMLRCPAPHAETFLVMSTGEMLGRMVRSGILACPACQREYPIIKGVVEFSGRGTRDGGRVEAGATRPSSPVPPPPVDAQTLQAVLDLSGPGGYVVLLGSAVRHATGLAALMGGIHFVGINAPPDVVELPVLSLLRCATRIPLKGAMARSVVVGADAVVAPWMEEAQRVLLPGRRLVVESEDVAVSPPPGVTKVAVGHGMFVGERR